MAVFNFYDMPFSIVDMSDCLPRSGDLQWELLGSTEFWSCDLICLSSKALDWHFQDLAENHLKICRRFAILTSTHQESNCGTFTDHLSISMIIRLGQNLWRNTKTTAGQMVSIWYPSRTIKSMFGSLKVAFNLSPILQLVFF